MRIGIDARELCGHATGAGRYLSGLLQQWAAAVAPPRHELILYAPERLEVEPHWRGLTMRLVEGAGTWWEQVRLPKAAAADRLDVFFAPAYTAPLRLRVPTVVAIHDVSFVAHPEWFRRREGTRRRLLTRLSARRARAVVTISEFSRRELIERLHLPGNRVHVIPPGISPAADSLAGPREPRVLFVGSIFNRRRLPDLVRAFGIVARRRPQASLDLVGDNRTHPHQDLEQAIAAEGLDGRIRWHRFVPDGQLRELYGRARAFAFLSEYEGLGLTPLEALAAGVPPVLLDTPVARESCGEAALYVDAGDVAGAAEALERLLADEETRSRLLAAAPAALARYQWPEAARRTLALIERAGTS
ncbi:MAG: glycosyltransferase family 1 protein [Acidobacteriota bacterium]